MKRLHVHTKVVDFKKNLEFYNTFFNALPTVEKKDYAKWILDDPRVNFSISLTQEGSGIEHLGVEVDSKGELEKTYKLVQDTKEKVGSYVREEGKTVCCYAKSEKSWISDPQGIDWEIFHTTGESDTYSGENNCSVSSNEANSKESTKAKVGCC